MTGLGGPSGRLGFDPVAARPRRPLTEPKPAIRSRPRERVLMPQSRPSKQGKRARLGAMPIDVMYGLRDFRRRVATFTQASGAAIRDSDLPRASLLPQPDLAQTCDIG